MCSERREGGLMTTLPQAEGRIRNVLKRPSARLSTRFHLDKLQRLILVVQTHNYTEKPLHS